MKMDISKTAASWISIFNRYNWIFNSYMIWGASLGVAGYAVSTVSNPPDDWGLVSAHVYVFIAIFWYSCARCADEESKDFCYKIKARERRAELHWKKFCFVMDQLDSESRLTIGKALLESQEIRKLEEDTARWL